MSVRAAVIVASVLLLLQLFNPTSARAADVEGVWIVTPLGQDPFELSVERVDLPPFFSFDLLLTTQDGEIRGIGVTSGQALGWIDEAGNRYSGVVIPILGDELITGVEVLSQVPFTAVRAP